MTGFSGVAVRSFINTFLLLGRPPRPTRMLASLDDAGAWLPAFLPENGWTPQALVDAIQQLMPSD